MISETRFGEANAFSNKVKHEIEAHTKNNFKCANEIIFEKVTERLRKQVNYNAQVSKLFHKNVFFDHTTARCLLFIMYLF